MADSSKGSPLLALLPELLTRVLKLLSSNRDADLIPYLTTCKLLFHHLRPMLWTDVSLNHGTILGFAAGCMYGNLSYQGVRTMVINLENVFQLRSYDWDCAFDICTPKHAEAIFEVDNNYKNSRRDLYHRLALIKAALVARISHLTSLSLIIDNDRQDDDWCLCCRDDIPERHLSSLLAAIPASCQCLMVDTGGAESQSGTAITKAISGLLPQLCSLRLRVRKISGKLFEFTNAPFDLLETCPILQWRNSKTYLDSPQSSRYQLDAWEIQDELGHCNGPTTDVLAFLNWSKLSVQERKSWEEAHKSSCADTPAVHVYGNMEEIVLNMCLHPFAPSTELEHTTMMSGLPAAAKLAINLQRAYRRGALPALKTCRIISSEFELTNTEILNQTHHESSLYDPLWALSIGGISEIVVYDVMKYQTIVMPFRRTKQWSDFEDGSLREQKVFEWRDGNDVAHLVSLKDIEQDLDIDTSAAHIPKTKNEIFPEHHTEIYDGLLDRIMIRQKRIDAGIADGRYWTQ